jgi:adenylate kinase family enzyme
MWRSPPDVGAVRFLNATDVLPARPQRVIVAGTSGSGKTHLAARIGAGLAIPHVEIDALHHGPAWTKRPTFEADVRGFAQSPQWVTEWQYSTARPILAECADLLVWLDLSLTRVMWQVTRRTIGRALRREVLWNGNLEPPLWTILHDRDHIVRWAWRTHSETRERVAALAAQRPHLTVVHLANRAEIERWVAATLARWTRSNDERSGVS